jgi:hypothetical protein
MLPISQVLFVGKFFGCDEKINVPCMYPLIVFTQLIGEKRINTPVLSKRYEYPV